MRLDKLLEVVTPESVVGTIRAEITGISHDSRRVRPGHLFVALRGRNHDGVRFVDEALRRGAAAILCESPLGLPPQSAVAIIRVADARRALALAACAFHGHPSRVLCVAGITGTNGKTTTSFLLRAILERAGRSTGLIGTIQYLVGPRVIPASRTTPESSDLQELLAEMVRVGCSAAVMEVSSHALAQRRVEGIAFDAAVFTNLTHDHLDFHGTEEAYFQAKTLLFRDLGREKRAFALINRDDPWGERLWGLPEVGGVRLSYGEQPAVDVRAEDVSVHPAGSSFRVRSPWGNIPIRLKLLGRFNVSNALAAFAAGCALGVTPEQAAAALENVVSVPGRLEPVPTNRGFQVYVDYAHTHDALQNVLTTLRELTARHLIVVFGCGGERDTRKRPLMGATATRLADYAVITSDNPRREPPTEILAQIVAGIEQSGRHEVIEDRREAIGRALRLAGPGDVVLVAGKGHENYQEFANTVVPFDDRQVVRECLNQWD